MGKIKKNIFATEITEPTEILCVLFSVISVAGF